MSVSDSFFRFGRLVGRCVVVATIAVALNACVVVPASHKANSDKSFDEALHYCRVRQPGKLNRKIRLPATHSGVARCLKFQGWSTDGTRLTPPDVDRQ